MADEERRHLLRRDEDRDLLVELRGKVGRLEEDVRELSAHLERELDALDLKYPSFDRVAKDYVPRTEHRVHAGDRRQSAALWVAISGLFLSPFLSAAAIQLVR